MKILNWKHILVILLVNSIVSVLSIPIKFDERESVHGNGQNNLILKGDTSSM